MVGELKNKYLFWKNLGETPLEALERLRAEEGIPLDVSMTYAGRLDPAAEGYLIILVGDECKKKESYMNLPKTYMAEILLGVTTDTYDLLGLPEIRQPQQDFQKTREFSAENSLFQNFFEKHIGKFSQTYPPYSSKTVDGVQLHEHSRRGSTVELPEHSVELFSYEDLSVEEIESEDILTRVGELTSSVTGDFRQNEIVQSWAKISLPEKMKLITVTLNVGGGFYVRQFAEDLGKELGCGACLYSLIRTKIGE